ncbi:MAG: exodeoxyribonuclease VII small subunit [Planctomycetes bacterium]|nr:exodeoxyribonuclease VII small subunit [Planctomycetota bacterium]
MADKKPTFEESLKTLESIADRIEQGQVGLEESIKLYEEGMKLAKHCRSALERAEQKIQQLQTMDQGPPQTKRFDPPS